MNIKNLKLRKSIVTTILACSISFTSCSYDTNEDIISSMDQIATSIESTESSKFTLEILEPYKTSEPVEATAEPEEVEEILSPSEAYTTADLNLRSNHSLDDDNIIDVIGKCQKVICLSKIGNWNYIQYGEEYGYVSSSYLKEVGNEYIEIDISDQELNYHRDEDIIVTSSIVTGKDGVTDTRIGMFDIDSMETNRYLTGPDYKSYVNYWMPFDGGIGLHDATWRDNFGSDIYVKHGSHGCVNLPLDIAKEIYDHASVGTKVLVHE